MKKPCAILMDWYIIYVQFVGNQLTSYILEDRRQALIWSKFQSSPYRSLQAFLIRISCWFVDVGPGISGRIERQLLRDCWLLSIIVTVRDGWINHHLLLWNVSNWLILTSWSTIIEKSWLFSLETEISGELMKSQ